MDFNFKRINLNVLTNKKKCNILQFLLSSQTGLSKIKIIKVI